MACCLLVLATVALARRAWGLLTGRGMGLDAAFAPPARRPAPDAHAQPLPVARSTPRAATAPQRDALTLRCCAAAACAYAVSIVVLAATGAVQSQGGGATWTLRAVACAVLAIALVRVAERIDPAGRHVVASRPRAGCLLLAGGATWFELGVLDMHAFGLLQVAGGSTAWDIVFHGVGIVAMAAGVATLARSPTPQHQRPRAVTVRLHG